MSRARPTTASMLAVAIALIPLTAMPAATLARTGPSNDPIGDQLSPGGPDIESLSVERTESALIISVDLVSAVAPPAADGSGLFGFVDLDSDRSANSGQQSAIDFLGANNDPVLHSHLGVEYQLVLSSYSSDDGAIDLIDQVTRQTVGRVAASFTGSTVTITVPESTLDPSILDALHLAAVVGTNDTFSDLAPNQGFLTTAEAEGESLLDGRFTVRVDWTNFQGESGVGTPVTKSNDSVLFWFFQASNWELLAKVIDGCGLNNRYWVFSAATTNVAYTLSVTDTSTGTVRVYDNQLGTAAPAITDIDAFASCDQ